MTIRIILSPTRSGSTALLRCFENNPAVDRVFHQPVKSGFRQGIGFTYDFFDSGMIDDSRIFVAKETIGGFEPPEVDFDAVPAEPSGLPTASVIRASRPIALFRDPLQTWNSIDKLNRLSLGKSRYFSPFGFFVTSYTNMYNFLIKARVDGLPVRAITVEQIAADPYGQFQQLCAWWDIPYHRTMVDWTQPYGVRTWFSDETRDRMANDFRFQLSKRSLEQSTRFGYHPSPLAQDLLLEDEVSTELSRLGELYRQVQVAAQTDFGEHG